MHFLVFTTFTLGNEVDYVNRETFLELRVLIESYFAVIWNM